MGNSKRFLEYIVIDFYENLGGEVIYTSDDYNDCKLYCHDFEEATDGECDLEIYQRNEKAGENVYTSTGYNF